MASAVLTPLTPPPASLQPQEKMENTPPTTPLDEKTPIIITPLDEKSDIRVDEIPTPGAEAPNPLAADAPHSTEPSLAVIEPRLTPEARTLEDVPEEHPEHPSAPTASGDASNLETPQIVLDSPKTSADGKRYSHPEFIEKLFQDAEEASERRAAEEEAREKAARRASANLSIRATSPVEMKGRRRGGSVSVSRFGAPPEASTPEGSVPATPSRLSTIVMQNPLYQQQLADRGSKDTIGSSTSEHSTHADEPTETVTRVTKIPGRSRSATLTKVVGAALSRRLSRAASKDALAPATIGPDVVIGVSVQSATVAVLADDADGRDGAEASKPELGAMAVAVVTATATATATGAATPAAADEGQENGKKQLKREKSKMSLLGKKDWFKSLTARFKRKPSREAIATH